MGGIISKRDWSRRDNKAVFLYRMENGSGAYVELTNYGAAIVSAVVPDRCGKRENVVLGFPSAEKYYTDTCYLGATIGRYANRIAKAGFLLDGSHYQLETNDGVHTNHGGTSGFNKQVYDVDIVHETLTFTLFSPDGAGGYPGNVLLVVSYRWSETNELHIHYTATTDKKTVLNLTNHAYFNLSGGKRKIFTHNLYIDASKIVETGNDYIPTGTVLPCGDLSFQGVPIIERMQQQGDEISGLNSCYVLNKTTGGNLQKAARLADNLSGRILEVYTTYPGLLLYTGDFLHSTSSGHGNRVYGPFDGLCLECQYFPDSPNHSGFPSTVLDAGDVYHEQIIYKFNVSSL